MLDDIVNVPPRRCLKHLGPENIVFTQDGQPRLIGVTLVAYSEKGAQSNYTSLADIIQYHLLSRSKLTTPLEVTHLLSLMREDAVAMAYAILYHSSVVPMELRNFMYLKHHQYVYGIMYRSPDLEALVSVLNNLLYDPEWATKIPARNYYLGEYLKRADYDPKGAKPGRFPGLEVMRYGRNGPEHPFDEALDLSSPFASRFTSTDVGHMFYANLPLLLCSLSAALHRQGRLRYLNLRPFFTNLPKPVAAPPHGFINLEECKDKQRKL